MNVLVIENEKPEPALLSEALLQLNEPLQVSECHSFEDSLHHLQGRSRPDLVFMDIPFRDHSPFNILYWASMNCPIVFVASYNEWLVRAFEFGNIDYLLKPVDSFSLRNMIDKYKNPGEQFSSHYPFSNGNSHLRNRKRSRIIARRGQEFQIVKVEDIACFYSRHKLVFLIDKNNLKYVAEIRNLRMLGEELDPGVFYRANRKYIINVNYINLFRNLARSKVSVELSIPQSEEIIISQEHVASFRDWISGG